METREMQEISWAIRRLQQAIDGIEIAIAAYGELAYSQNAKVDSVAKLATSAAGMAGGLNEIKTTMDADRYKLAKQYDRLAEAQQQRYQRTARFEANHEATRARYQK